MTDTRNERLDRLRRKERVCVLVVGGGINGISTYRELALQGVDVVLVERGDFMSGASAAPSRMIHGGLRYMENGEFALVRESLAERNRLLANAPHYVSPLPTLIPITDWFSGVFLAAWRFLGGKPKPGVRGALIVKLGLTLYDLYSGRAHPMPRHRFFGRGATRRNWPAFNADVTATALYYDARISYPERLGVEMLLDMEREAPEALALNHVGLTALAEGEASLTDALTGERFTLRPDIVVNATGAWIDLTNQTIDGSAPRLIGGTKGSHLILNSPALAAALGDRMVYFANREGRVCILFVHLGHVLAGSTDISVDTPDGIRCEPAETAYILQSVREIFPAIALGENDIVYRFAGVRPLPRSDASVNAAISRDHRCEWLEGGVPVLNLIGGKWTTFRAFGAEAADLVMARSGASRRRSTDALAIGGGADFPADPATRETWILREAAETGLSTERVATLLDRYGTRLRDVALTPDDRPLASLPSYSRNEIEWLVETEHVATLGDLVLRRMAIAFTGELSPAALEELADIAGAMLGWDAGRRQAEISSLVERLATFHDVDLRAQPAHTPQRTKAHVSI